LLVRRTCCVLIVGVVFPGAVAVLPAQDVGNESALAIHRIILQPHWVAKEMEKVHQGTLLYVPLAEFDARMERVRKMLQAREQKPRLTRAHYRAELVDAALVNGVGQWTISHPGGQPGILPVPSINLATHEARWKTGGDAAFAEFDGKSLGLLVPKPSLVPKLSLGPQEADGPVCEFTWSARGSRTSDGTAFKLIAPPCALSTYELRLPADAWLTAGKDAALVTGPHETETSAKRLWRLQALGAKPVEFVVRSSAMPKVAATSLFARVHSEQKVLPDRTDLEHDIQIDIPQGGLRTLTLEGDAGLQPYDVTWRSGEIKSFQWTEPANVDSKASGGRGALGQLVIEMSQPVHGKVQGLHVKSYAPRSSATAWTSPLLRVKGAASRGETLTVHLGPDLAMAKWDHGAFRPTQLDTRPDGTQLLTLAQAVDDAGARRPTLMTTQAKSELQTSEDYAWHISPRGAHLNADIHWTAVNGAFFALRVKLPKTSMGYQVESVDVQPAGWLRGWHAEAGFLVVELTQPLANRRTVNLKVRLQASLGAGQAQSDLRMSSLLSYPELEPMDAAKRRGAVSIHVGPNLQAQLVSSTLPPAPPASTHSQAELGNEGATPPPSTRSQAGLGNEGAVRPPSPRSQALLGNDGAPASFRFDFRDQKLAATVRVIPLAMQLRLHGKHIITLRDDGAAMRFRWDVEPLAGAADHVDFRFPPNFPPSWKIVEEEGLKIQRWERLPQREWLPHLLHLGSSSWLQAATLRALIPEGTYWRFHFATPTHQRARFVIEATAPAGVPDDQWRRLALRVPRERPWDYLASSLAEELLRKEGSDKSWTLPLMMPVQQAHVGQEIAVESRSDPVVQARSNGALRMTPAPAAKQAPVHVQFRQADEAPSDPASQILVATRPHKHSASTLAYCDEAGISTFIHKDGRVYHRVGFRLWHWRDPTLVLGMPPGYHVVSVKIHGRVLDRFAVDQAASQARITLPADQNAESVRYEIDLRASAGAGGLPGLMRVEAPRIDWPMTPLESSRRFFLESGLMPLHQEILAPVGVPSAMALQTETPARLRRAWTWGHQIWPFGALAAETAKLDDQRQIVLLAESKLRETAQASKPMTLGDALDRLALDHLKDAAPLVLDRMAFRALGLNPATALPSTAWERGGPFWETLGLVYVPCPDAALLTSPARLQALGIRSPADTYQLRAALREAVLHGNDRSAAFALVVAWLAQSGHAGAESPLDTSLHSADAAGEDYAMVEWRLLPARSVVREIWVVDPLPARVWGWLGAALAAVVVWRLGRRTPVTVLRAYLALVAACAFAAIWLPVRSRELFLCPTILVLALGFLWHFVRYVVRRDETLSAGPSTTSRIVGTAAMGAILLIGAYSAPAQAPAAKSYAVLVVDGAKPAALITPELQARLDELENQLDSVGHPAVLVGAAYTGKVQDNLAIFEANYDVLTFKPKASLLIPLQGVELHEGATLNGTPVFPTAHKNGFQVPIRDAGSHRLRVAFGVRIGVAGEQNELRFAIPKLVRNEMTVQWLSGVQTIQCMQCMGEERTTTITPPAQKEWRGQLGYVGNVHIRFTRSQVIPVGKVIHVKEGHFWDLRPGGLSLVSAFNYTLGKDSIAQLAIALPEALQVRAVAARRSQPQPGTEGDVAVKRWSVVGKGAQRRLIVEFAQPVVGNVALHLDLLPLFPSSAGERADGKLLPLLLPGPVQGKSSGGILAYRMDADARPKALNLSVASISAEEFEQRWKKHGAPAVPAAATRAYNFQRAALQAGLEVVVEPSDQKAQLDVQWHFDKHHADFIAKCVLTSSRDDLTLLEFHVDKALVLASVQGPDVARWHAQESTLQVWLRQPRKTATIEISGWLARGPKGTTTPIKGVSLPAVHPLHVRLGPSTLAIRTPADLQATAEPRRGLRPSPTNALHFDIVEAPFEAAVALQPRKKASDAAALTRLNAGERGLELVHAFRVTTERGVLPALKVHVAGGPDGRPELDAPGAAITLIANPKSNSLSWDVQYPPGMPREVLLSLRWQIPKDANGLALPSVTLDGAMVRDHWLAWKNLELANPTGGKVVAPQPAARDRAVGAFREPWLPEPETWRVVEGGKTPLEVRFPKATPTDNVRILARRADARLSDAGGWRHEAAWLIHATESAELRVRFASPVDAVSAMIDDRVHPVWTPVANEFALAVDASPGPFWLTLRWRNAGANAEWTAPSVVVPIIHPGPATAVARTLWLPPGMHLDQAEAPNAPTFVARLLAAGDQRLHVFTVRAEAMPHTAETTRELARQQQSLRALLRHAEYAAAILKPLLGADAVSPWNDRRLILQQRLAELNKEHQLDDASAAKPSPRRALHDGTFSAGVPILLTADQATVRLQFDTDRRVDQQRAATELVAVAVLFLFLVTLFRRGWSMLLSAAPEMTIVLAAAGMEWAGPSLLGAFLIAAMLLVRCVWVVNVLRKRRAAALAADDRTSPSSPIPVA
jgi:hypothetical protein